MAKTKKTTKKKIKKSDEAPKTKSVCLHRRNGWDLEPSLSNPNFHTFQLFQT